MPRGCPQQPASAANDEEALKQRQLQQQQLQQQQQAAAVAAAVAAAAAAPSLGSERKQMSEADDSFYGYDTFPATSATQAAASKC